MLNKAALQEFITFHNLCYHFRKLLLLMQPRLGDVSLEHTTRKSFFQLLFRHNGIFVFYVDAKSVILHEMCFTDVVYFH